MVQPKYNPQTKRYEFPKPVVGKKRAAPVRGDISSVSIPNSVFDRVLAAAEHDGADIKINGVREPRRWKARGVVKLYTLQAIEEFLAARGKSAAK